MLSKLAICTTTSIKNQL